MNTSPNTSKSNLVALKIYFDRARMYLGYINFFLLNMVLINSFDNSTMKNLLSEYQLIAIPVLFIVYLLALLFIGYLDTKWGLRQEEMRNNAMNNPVMQDLLKTVRDIKSDVAQIKKS
jgi:hypothetical protein